MRVVSLVAMAAALFIAGCVSENRPSSCAAPAITIELALDADGLTPSDPSVCAGQEVTLQISPEVDGVFHIHGQDENISATEVADGEDLELTFTPDRSGQYPIEFHPADDPQGVAIGIFTVYDP